ncbi:MAG: HAMP domain-containing protein [Actinomycetota bacterium]
MKIRNRLLLGLLGIVAVFALFGGYTYIVWESIDEDAKRMEVIYQETVVRNIERLDTTLNLALAVRNSESSLADVSAGDAAAYDQVITSFDEFDALHDELAASLAEREPIAAEEFAAIRATHDQLRRDVEALLVSNPTSTDDASAAAGDAVFDEEWMARIDAEFAAIDEGLIALELAYEEQTIEASSEFDSILLAIEERIRRIETVMLVVLGLAILLAFGLGYRTAQSISRPVEQLSEAALALEAGDYQEGALDEVVGRSDELGRFARLFQKMAEEVRARETKLRERIRALTVEIDRTRSNEQVEEIADTDFFRSLQQRARELRAQSRPTGDDST